MPLRALQRVDVEVDRARQEDETVDPALLDRLPSRRGREVRVAGLAVAAHLEPAADLRMEREQGAGAGRVHHERAAGQVAVGARTPHRVLVAGEVVEELPAHRVLVVVRRLPTPEERDRRRRGGRRGARRASLWVAYRRAVSDTDPARFATHVAAPRGFRQAYVHEGAGGVPVVCVHGWPETKRIFWRVIEPLADAGFEVIVPDLRGFGESELGPDGFHDVPAHSHDLYALVHDAPRARARSCWSAATSAARSSRTSPCATRSGSTGWCCSTRRCPTTRSAMAGMRHPPGARRPATTSSARAPTPTGWPRSCDTPEQRRRYIATFYTSRFWAHPGAFDRSRRAAGSLRRQRGRRLPHRAVRRRRPSCGRSFGGYESVFDPAARSEAPLLSPQRPHADARPLRRRRTTCSTPTSTAWRRRSSGVTWARSCCATAVTSSRGRRRTRSSAARRLMAADLLADAPIEPGVKGLISRR